MKKFLLSSLAVLSLVISACGKDEPYDPAKEKNNAGGDEVKVESVPSSLGLNSFYKKYVDANGIPVVGSDKVSDDAILMARTIVTEMLADLSPQVRLKMKTRNTYMIVMAESEMTTDIPEYAYLKNDPNTNWDQRARGLGGNDWYPYSSCAEENLLHLQNDRYYDEDITIHEFSHSIHNLGLAKAFSDFNTKLEKAYNDAKASGKWANTYAMDNMEEYFAEGVQDWYDVNNEVNGTNGIHNKVNTREELERYDKELYDLIAEYFEVPDTHFSRHPKVNKYNYE